MRQSDMLERDLATWFAATAAPQVPDYTDDILGETACARQRPEWAFASHWLPAPLVNVRRVSLAPLALLALLTLLLAGTLGYWAGSQRLGVTPAEINGLVAFEEDGDIRTVDPKTGTRASITSGPAVDHDPRWSPDGTRIAFIRETVGGDRVVVVDADGSNPVMSVSILERVDGDGLGWSPDSQRLIIWRDESRPGAALMDALDGSIHELPRNILGGFWRPWDGPPQLLVVPFGGPALLSPDDGSQVALPPAPWPRYELRPFGFTPDGTRVVYHWTGGQTAIVEIASGTTTILPLAFAHVSNDGTRVVGLDANGDVCVMPIAGGSCVRIATSLQAYEGTHAGGVTWAPDDQAILVTPFMNGAPILLDPEGGPSQQPEWLEGGWESWQRKPQP